MRYSKLFGKTVREAPKDAVMESHKLLYRGGFIRDLVAGRYLFTPLGFRVLEKIIKIIDEEMKAIGGQRVGTPTLHPLELWQATHRDEAFGAGLMQVKDRRGGKYAIGATAEAVMVEFVKKFKPSWKDLPIIIYQFSQKFRDELRARGGVIRLREFLMKDAYSFAADEEGFMQTYWDHYHAYEKIAKRLGIKVIPVEAESGALGGNFCHEFIFPCKTGEDTILVCKECGYAANKEKAEFMREDVNINEEEKDFEIVGQPEWVESMDDNVKHYKLPKERFLKNVVYKTAKGKMIIAVIRGDLDINESKLTRVVGEGELVSASDDNLKKMGTRPGWVHCWGHPAKYVGDISLKTVKNFIGGQKEKTTDSINVNYGRDFQCETLDDIAEAKDGYLCGKCKKGKMEEIRGIEFGHVFKFGYFYTEAMGGTFIDKDGKEKYLHMGSYGIGTERAMGIVVEAHHDNKGIIWPREIAPFEAHLLDLDIQKRKDKRRGEEIYEKLQGAGIEVLYDDREDISVGVKFADADLIGIPVRLVISEKTGEKIEYKERVSEKTELLEIHTIIKKLRE